MKAVIKSVKVIARATDEDKNLMVAAIKSAGGFILMTGDGINDTEALALAHVGVSMGTSCQVTKDSSDLTILDNDIRSVYLSIMWGRTIYENVRKFIQFQMTMNIAVVVLLFIAFAVMGVPGTPFNVIHLLWMNLVMDVLAAISICTEPFDSNPKRESENYKLRRISKSDAIFNDTMWRNIIPMAFF
jgi:Ca2+-transporting ATPase